MGASVGSNRASVTGGGNKGQVDRGRWEGKDGSGHRDPRFRVLQDPIWVYTKGDVKPHRV